MKYSDARKSLRSGDLIALSHTAWRTRHDLEIQLVRMATRSEWAHTAVCWCIGERVLLIEAVVPEVRIFPLSRSLPAYWLSGEVRNPWTEETELTAMSKIGERYSKLEAVKSFFTKITPGADEKWVCSELAAYIRSQMLLENYESPTPSSLVQSALAGGASLVMLTEE